MSEPRDTTADSTISSWLEALADAGPNPGGGAAAALLAGMAAALAEMVAGLSLENTRRDDRERQMRAHLKAASAIRVSAPTLADGDAHTSSGFASAYALPEGSQERDAAISSASIAGAESAAALGKAAANLAQVLKALVADVQSPLLQADVAVSASTLAASVRAAAINMAADLHLADDAAAARPDLYDTLKNLDAVALELDSIPRQVRTALSARRTSPPSS